VRALGSGGMGTVLLAERDDGAFARQVAIKLVQPGPLLFDPERRAELERRFLEERAVLAQLDHPNIARLYDGGTTDDGWPYIVMEYVEGVAIDRYCREHELDLLARLALVRDVARAVQFAHQKLIAHRDLKPANVLVGRAEDGTARVKLLDFGIAKLLGSAGSELRTTIGSARLTPAYASPEQVRGEPASAASDVYSLGVVLYELATGRLPYEAPLGAPEALMLAVCNSAPRRPEGLDKRYARDLETILFKALEKDAARRYASAGELADDLERLATGHPIRARPATLGYRLGKALRRNRKLASAAAFAVLAIAGLSTWSFVLRRSTALAHERAEREQLHASQATALFREIFAAPDPFERFGKDVTVAQVLDDAAPRVLERLAQQPEVRLELTTMIADTYDALGVPAKALGYARESVATAERLFGVGDPRALEADVRLVLALLGVGEGREAEQVARAALEVAERELPGGHATRLALREVWYRALREIDEDARAEELTRELLAESRRIRGPLDPRTIQHVVDLSAILIDHQEVLEAEALLRSTLAALGEPDGPLRKAVLAMRANLGFLLMRTGNTVEALEVVQSVYGERERLLGLDHVDTLSSMHDLAELELTLGRPQRCEEILLDLRERRGRVQGADHPDALAIAIVLASALGEQGRVDEAERELQQAWEAARRVHGRENYIATSLQGHLGLLLASMGLLHEAEALQRELIEIFEASREVGAYERASSRNNLAQTLNALQQFEEAEGLQRSVVESNREHLGEAHPNTIVSIANLGMIRRTMGDLAGAQVAHAEAVQLAEAALGSDNTLLGGCYEGYARYAVLAGHFDEAECNYLAAQALYERVLGPQHPAVRIQTEALATMWERAGEPERAARYREQLPREP
jgi:tetratricopeptide (TPR) repeat protein